MCRCRIKHYYDRQGVPLYHELAETFTLCDAYHCSVLSETTSNRNYFFTGYTGYEPGSSWRAINGEAHNREDKPEGYGWVSYAELLEKNGKTWKVYQEWDNHYDNNLEFFATFKEVFRKALAKVKDAPNNLFHFYQYLADANSQEYVRRQVKALATAATQLDAADRGLYERGLYRRPTQWGTTKGVVQALRADVRANTLPQVSWIVPSELDSEHSGGSIPRCGEKLLYQVLDALALNPEIWDSTVLFLSYDENDGLFDHMPPPVPPDSREDSDEFFRDQPLGLGIRVPFIAVSPWTAGGYICSQVFDHTSQIQFLEKWLHVSTNQISPWRRTVAGDLTSLFDFDTASARPPAISGTRRARALPYQPDAHYNQEGKKEGNLILTLANTGTASTHLTLYPYTGGYNYPQHFDVSPGEIVEEYVLSAATVYDFTVLGPNGFRREFRGPRSGSGTDLAVTTAVDAASRTLEIALDNRSAHPFTVTLRASFGPIDKQEHHLAPGRTTRIAWDTTAAHGWYDLTLSPSSKCPSSTGAWPDIWKTAGKASRWARLQQPGDPSRSGTAAARPLRAGARRRFAAGPRGCCGCGGLGDRDQSDACLLGAGHGPSPGFSCEPARAMAQSP